MRSIICLTCLICVPAQVALGQTVEYDVRPTSSTQVTPGATVNYEVVISVSDDGTNDGLLFFSFDLLTDLGIEQSVAGIAWDPVISTFFDILGGPFPGEPNEDGIPGTDDDDDIIFWSGSQGFGGPGDEPFIAQPGPQVIVSGVLETDPGVEDTFTVTVANSFTQLVSDDDGDDLPDSLINDNEFTTTFGPGFQIQVLPDADQDGVPDIDDVCPGFDDNADADGDNTPDGCDGCANDAAKTSAGQCGCGVADTDTDGDGTADCVDGCATDAAKTAPGFCGCGTPDTNTDGDPAVDCLDDCPSDPNKISPGACGCGTADTDSDDDGLADCIDVDPVVDGACGACGALGMVLFPLALIGYAVLLFSKRRIL